MMSEEVDASSSIRAPSAPAASTALAHVPTATPYGGCAAIELAAELAQVVAAGVVVGVAGQTVGRREHRAQRTLGCSGAAWPAAQHERPLLDGIEQLVDGRARRPWRR